MMGRAGSQGPYISFLYFCSPMSHQLQIPIARNVRMLPNIIPAIHAPWPLPVSVANTAPLAVVTNRTVKAIWPRRDLARSWRRKIGNKPNTSMENSVREKTCVVEGSLEARTVDAMSAELVEIDAGRLHAISHSNVDNRQSTHCPPLPLP